MLKFIKSVIKSASRGIYNDPEVKKLIARYPRFFYFVKKRLTPDERFGLYLTVGTIITLFFAYLFFGIIEDLVGQQPLIQSDLRIINLLQIFRSPAFNQAMLFITFLGKGQIIFFGVLACGLIYIIYKRWHYLITLILSVGGGEFFIFILKNLIKRERPPLIHALTPEASYSFPSGHGFVAIAFYGFLAYVLFRSTASKLLKIFYFVAGLFLVLAIGFSRIYLGVHWPSDVLASYASGAAWLTVLITALEIRRKFNYRAMPKPYWPETKAKILITTVFVLWAIFIGYYFIAHPITAPKAVAENQVKILVSDIPKNLFTAFPKTSENITGGPMEPINIIIIGDQKQLMDTFRAAGWLISDPITVKSIWRLIVTSVFNERYDQAPGTPSFWNARPNDLSFEQPTPNYSVRERHHLHIWKTPFIVGDKDQVWFGTAHFDKTIRIKSSLILTAHNIDPAVDKERDKIKSDLMQTKNIEKFEEFKIVEPTLGQNQLGDSFFTDGKSYIFFLK